MEKRGFTVSTLILVIIALLITIGAAYKIYELYRSTEGAASTIGNPVTTIEEVSSNALLVLPTNPSKSEQALLTLFQRRGLISDFKFIESVTAEDLIQYDKVYVICTECTKHIIDLFLGKIIHGNVQIYLLTPFFYDYSFIISRAKGYSIIRKEGYSIEDSEVSFSVNEYNSEYSTICVETSSGRIGSLILDMDTDVGFDNVLTRKDLESPITLRVKSAVVINPESLTINLPKGGTIQVSMGNVITPSRHDNVKYIYIYIYNNRLYVYADGELLLNKDYRGSTITITINGFADYVLYSKSYVLFENMYPLYNGRTACLTLHPLQGKIGIQTIYSVKTRVLEGSHRNKIYLTLANNIYSMLVDILHNNEVYREYVFFTEGVGLYEIVGFGELGKRYITVPKFKNCYIVPGPIVDPENPLFVELISRS